MLSSFFKGDKKLKLQQTSVVLMSFMDGPKEIGYVVRLVKNY